MSQRDDLTDRLIRDDLDELIEVMTFLLKGFVGYQNLKDWELLAEFNKRLNLGRNLLEPGDRVAVKDTQQRGSVLSVNQGAWPVWVELDDDTGETGFTPDELRLT